MDALSRRSFLRLSSLAVAASAAAGESSKIRAGQVGTGHAHASGKWETLVKSPDFEPVGIAESDPQRRTAAERLPAYAGARWMTEAELLASPGLQAIAVETEVKDLLATAGRCLAAGKHVHLDKPAGEDLALFRSLREAAERRNLVVQMGYMFRYHPAFLLCRALAAGGALGKIFSIEASMSKRLLNLAPLLPYRGGSMFELGCHVIDPVIGLLGPPSAVRPFHRSTSTTRDGFPDNQAAILEYPDALVIVRSTLAEWHGESRRAFTVCGDAGTCQIEPLEPASVRLTLARPYGDYQKGTQDVHLAPPTGRYDADFADLARVIRGEKAFDFSAAHDLAVQETVLRASGLM